MSIKELTNRSKRRSFFSEKFGSMYDKIAGSSVELIGSLKGSIAVRKMLAEDEDEAKNLIRNSLLEFGGIGVDSLYFDNDLEYLYDNYTKKDSRVIVATKGGEIIGTAAFKPLMTEDGQLVEGVVELNHVYVRNGFRNQGVGKKLLDRMSEEAKALGNHTCMASVSSVFRTLNDLLLRNGFRPSDLEVRFHNNETPVKRFVRSL